MNANHQTLHDCLAEHYSDVIANHDSVIGILYGHYSESNNADHPQIHAALKKLREQLVTVDVETIMSTVFELCTLHEECGFRGGLDMGIALAMELTSGK